MAERPLVVPVSAADALAWAEGRLNDTDLLLKAPLVPEAVFLVNLPPGGAAYRELCRQAAYWKERGAVCLIVRTGSADAHVLKMGCIATLRENTNPIKTRYFAPPEAFTRWTERFCRTARPRNGPALPRDPKSG